MKRRGKRHQSTPAVLKTGPEVPGGAGREGHASDGHTAASTHPRLYRTELGDSGAPQPPQDSDSAGGPLSLGACPALWSVLCDLGPSVSSRVLRGWPAVAAGGGRSPKLGVSWTAIRGFQTDQDGRLIDLPAGRASRAEASGESGPLLSLSSISSFRENAACRGCRANTEQRYLPLPHRVPALFPELWDIRGPTPLPSHVPLGRHEAGYTSPPQPSPLGGPACSSWSQHSPVPS